MLLLDVEDELLPGIEREIEGTCKIIKNKGSEIEGGIEITLGWVESVVIRLIEMSIYNKC